jgi:phosphoribosylpyrophosphate synthetase
VAGKNVLMVDDMITTAGTVSHFADTNTSGLFIAVTDDAILSAEEAE